LILINPSGRTLRYCHGLSIDGVRRATTLRL
jgi:hypothetical protein